MSLISSDLSHPAALCMGAELQQILSNINRIAGFHPSHSPNASSFSVIFSFTFSFFSHFQEDSELLGLLEKSLDFFPLTPEGFSILKMSKIDPHNHNFEYSEPSILFPVAMNVWYNVSFHQL